MTVSLGDICRVVNVKKDFKGQHLGVNSFLSSKKCLVYLSALVLVFLPHKPFDANNVHLCISIYIGELNIVQYSLLHIARSSKSES